MSMVYFVSGTDTDVGKTVATGFLARRFAQRGLRVITQKLVQTGCEKISDDIVVHRKIMGIDLLPEDLDSTTCAYVFGYPASPHLAAALEGVRIDPAEITRRTRKLEELFDVVLLEGAGGLIVPLTDDLLTIDYAAEFAPETFLVVSSKLGGLNHALLSLEACRARGMRMKGVVYNTFADVPADITKSTADFIKKYLSKHFPSAEFITMPKISF